MMITARHIKIAITAQYRDVNGIQVLISVKLIKDIVTITNMHCKLMISSNMETNVLILLDFAKEKTTRTRYNLS